MQQTVLIQLGVDYLLLKGCVTVDGSIRSQQNLSHKFCNIHLDSEVRGNFLKVIIKLYFTQKVIDVELEPQTGRSFK